MGLVVLMTLMAGVALGQLQVTVNTSVISDYSNVAVSWSGAASFNPSTDYITVFSPPLTDPQSTIVMLNSSMLIVNGTLLADWSQNGGASGSFSAGLVNNRLSYQFCYFRLKTQTQPFMGISLACSSIISTTQTNPLQGHLALTGDHTEMRLVFQLGINTSATVEWGTGSGHYTGMSSGAQAYTYTEDQMCGNTAAAWFRPPGFFYDLKMHDLKPLTQYYYRFGSAAGYSQEFSFLSAPAPGNPNQPVRMLAYGDMGTGDCGGNSFSNFAGWCEYPSLNTSVLLSEHLPGTNLALHIGDISYAVGHSYRWDAFMSQIQPVAAQLPYMTAIGNHEMDWDGSFNNYMNSNDSGGECGIPYNARFRMPSTPPFQAKKPASPKTVHYYSFEYGSVTFVIIDTETDLTPGSIQHAWIHATLASVDRKRTPWLIMGGHRPMYVSTYDWPGTGKFGDQAFGEVMKESLEKLLYDYDVDLALWGHVHLYERTCPIYQYNCVGNYSDPGAPIHAVIGMAGMYLSYTTVMPQPSWSTVRTVQFGYTILEALNATSFHFRFYEDNGNLVDDWWINKQSHLLYLE
jgi:hypothetical protein